MAIKIALAGNPNAGKTTLFNALTGSNQFVGNWPGVTVEKKEGKLKGHKDVTITDLPGIYSLSPYTLEEVVARNYLLNESPDAILNIIDGSNLERNLYLTTQLTELGIPVIMAVNMMDVVSKHGDKIDFEKLGKSLGCVAAPISALKGTGIKEVAEKAVKAAQEKKASAPVHTFSNEAEKYIDEIAAKLDVPDEQKRFYAIKLFERDDKIGSALKNAPDVEDIIKKAEAEFDDDPESIITNERYTYITSIIGSCYKKAGKQKLTISDKIDKIVTNRILALPIFAAIMFIVYYISVTTIGTFATDWANDGLFGDGYHLFGIGSAEYSQAVDDHAAKELWNTDLKADLTETIEAAAKNGAKGTDDLLKAIKDEDYGAFEEAYESYSDSVKEHLGIVEEEAEKPEEAGEAKEGDEKNDAAEAKDSGSEDKAASDDKAADDIDKAAAEDKASDEKDKAAADDKTSDEKDKADAAADSKPENKHAATLAAVEEVMDKDPDPAEYGVWIPGVPVVVENFLDSIGTAEWLKSLILDGIVAGVGAVLGFVPQMLVLFILLAFLESCGYMARVAFIMDRIFRRFGLSGKSFIPYLIGTGCGVPAVMASRTIENERDRRMTIMTTTFMPCGAKLPIIALIATAVFGGAAWVGPSAYFVGIAAIICSGIILKKTKMFSGDPAPFVMELPPYHMPTVGNVLRSMWERGWSFIKKAGTIILLSSIIIWAGSRFGNTGNGFGFSTEMELEDSVLGMVGRAIMWIFTPLGFDNIKATIATLMGLVAKEEVVGVFGVLDFEGMTQLAAYSFLLFNLLCAPCFAAIGAIRREMNNAKWTWFAIGYQCVFAYIVALCVFQFGTLFTGGGFGIFTIVAILLVALFIYLLCRPYKESTKLDLKVR